MALICIFTENLLTFCAPPHILNQTYALANITSLSQFKPVDSCGDLKQTVMPAAEVLRNSLCWKMSVLSMQDYDMLYGYGVTINPCCARRAFNFKGKKVLIMFYFYFNAFVLNNMTLACSHWCTFTSFIHFPGSYQ